MTMQERVDAAIGRIMKCAYSFNIEGWSFRKWRDDYHWVIGIRAHHSNWYCSIHANVDFDTEAEADAAIAYAKGRIA